MIFFKGYSFTKVFTLLLTLGLLFVIIGCSKNPDDVVDTIDETVLVTGITLQSEGDVEIIETLGGTLQLSSTVTPNDATNKSITWSVVNGTGSATINQSGLLTAATNGTVTVKAVSVSVPSLNATLVITISNQEVLEKVLVTGVTLQSAADSTTIETLGGTLQLSSTVTPSNATDKSVTWSVVDGTGSATIDQSGLLSAVEDGTVTVSVTSVDVLSIKAELVVTISNQVTDHSAPLAYAILEANQNLEVTMVGSSSDEFVPEVEWVFATDYDLYVAAVINAELILSSTTLTEIEVTEAISILALATDEFNSSKQNGTKALMKISLGSAKDFVILSKTGVSTTGTTSITGNIGVSPAPGSYITGFALIMDSDNEFSTSSLVTGQIYAADYMLGTPTYLTTAIEDVLIAYNDGAGRTADYNELFTGDLSGKTLSNGVYKWGGDVLINSNLTLHGTATDVLIFQIAGTLTMASNTQIILTGGLLAENIFWVVANTVAVGVDSAFQGVILSTTNVSMNTGSSIVGMIYAQTSVSLAASTITKP